VVYQLTRSLEAKVWSSDIQDQSLFGPWGEGKAFEWLGKAYEECSLA
jgi:hypothetical protein